MSRAEEQKTDLDLFLSKTPGCWGTTGLLCIAFSPLSSLFFLSLGLSNCIVQVAWSVSLWMRPRNCEVVRVPAVSKLSEQLTPSRTLPRTLQGPRRWYHFACLEVCK